MDDREDRAFEALIALAYRLKEFRMDTRSGKFWSSLTEAKKQLKQEYDERFMMQMEVPPTTAQMSRIPPRIGRNEACPCGSGKKFKKCCWGKQTKTQPGETGIGDV